LTIKKNNSANLITKCFCKCKCNKCSSNGNNNNSKSINFNTNFNGEKIPNFTTEINDFKNEGMKKLFQNFKIFENFPIKNLLEFIFVFCEMSLTR